MFSGRYTYSLEMQFRREVCEKVQTSIRNTLLGNPEHSGRVIRLSGEAGIGKTVALRTVAFDLAQDEFLCLWIKKSYGEVSGARFDAVVESLAKDGASEIKRFVALYPLALAISLFERFQ